MGYPPRLCFEGAIYHVTARGNNRAPIFLDDAGRASAYLATRRTMGRWGWTIWPGAGLASMFS